MAEDGRAKQAGVRLHPMKSQPTTEDMIVNRVWQEIHGALYEQVNVLAAPLAVDETAGFGSAV